MMIIFHASEGICWDGNDLNDNFNRLGGPLMGEDTSNSRNPYSYLAGIVSFGPANCGTPNYPGVYTVKPIIISPVSDNLNYNNKCFHLIYRESISTLIGF